VRLEEADFAYALGRDAAGREVGDAAGSKFEADVGDIDFVCEHGQAPRHECVLRENLQMTGRCRCRGSSGREQHRRRASGE